MTLAIKLDGKLRLLLEVKAIGIELKDTHVKQAIDYAANQGIEWVALSNGVAWRIYKVNFGQPISFDLVEEFDFLTLNAKSDTHLESLFLLTKEGLTRSALEEYHQQRQAMSRFCIGAMLLSEPVLEVVRRELRRLSPGVKIDVEEIRGILIEEVLKREVTEGDKAEEARRKIGRSQGRTSRSKKEPEAADPALVKPIIIPPAAAQA